MELKQESFFLSPLDAPGEKLHLKRWHAQEGPPVLMIHGAIENGKIFYSDSGKGFAPFLAKNGFDVYVGDLRGRGGSLPPISRFSRHGQTESILNDIPAFSRFISGKRPGTQQIWVGHSWGGVLLLSTWARMQALRESVKGMIFFGSKRTVHVQNLERFFKIDFFWQRFASFMTRVYGYLPAREWGIGSDNESRDSHAQSKAWVRPGAWVDPRDHFDYATAAKEGVLPSSLFLAGKGDHCLGHPRDVLDLVRESQAKEYEFWVLSKAFGNRHDYGHIDMLTHIDAESDHFVKVLKWLRETVS